MNFILSAEDFIIIQNALHYYKKTKKRGRFQKYNWEYIEALRDKLAQQVMDQ
jgi:hypothetical protein